MRRSEIPVLSSGKVDLPALRDGLRCLTPSTIDAWSGTAPPQHGDKPMVIDPDDRISYAELDASTRDLAAAFIEAGVGKGTRVGLIMPNGVRLGADRARADPHRRRAGPAEHAAAAARTGRAAAGRRRCSILIAVEEFRGHRYLDDLPPTIGELPATARDLRHRCGRLRQPRDARRRPDRSTRMAATVTPSDTLVIMFTSGSSGPPKGVIHSHGNALGAVRSGLAARCIDADTRLYLPMPFFWVGGFGSGMLSALLAGATLVTEAMPAAGDDAATAGTRAGHAVSRLARPGRSPGAPIATRSEPTCPRCGRAAWRRCCRPTSGRRRVRARSCSA